jgi:hypothetical protein
MNNKSEQIYTYIELFGKIIFLMTKLKTIFISLYVHFYSIIHKLYTQVVKDGQRLSKTTVHILLIKDLNISKMFLILS